MILKSEYQHLRKLANARGRRLEAAGFAVGYKAPKASELTAAELKREYKKLEKWLDSPTATVKGARRAAIEAAERKEAARLRKNETERERYRQKKEAEGKKVRQYEKDLTEEQKREKRRQKARERYQKSKDFKQELRNLKKTSPKEYTALNNLLSGLRKYGIKVNSLDELRQWGAYISERDKDGDANKYEFDKWLDEAAEHAQKDIRNLKPDDIDRLVNDFNEWQANNADLVEEFTRERTNTEYDSTMMGSLWDIFVHI